MLGLNAERRVGSLLSGGCGCVAHLFHVLSKVFSIHIFLDSVHVSLSEVFFDFLGLEEVLNGLAVVGGEQILLLRSEVDAGEGYEIEWRRARLTFAGAFRLRVGGRRVYVHAIRVLGRGRWGSVCGSVSGWVCGGSCCGSSVTSVDVRQKCRAKKVRYPEVFGSVIQALDAAPVRADERGKVNKTIL